MVVGNECFNVNIFAAITQDLGSNKYEAATSTGKRIQAFNAVPDYPVFIGDKVGVIQIGNEYCVFNAKAPLRSVIALDNPLEYGKIYPEQYFMAIVAHRLGNIKRLYEVWTAGYVNINKSGSFTLARPQGGGNTTLRIADWISPSMVEVGKPVLVDTELNQVVGLLYEIKDATPFLCRANVKVPICDELGHYIDLPANTLCMLENLSDKEVSEHYAIGNFAHFYTFAPAEYRLSFSYGGHSYTAEFEIPRKLVLDKGVYSGSGEVDAVLTMYGKYGNFEANTSFKPKKLPTDDIIIKEFKMYSYSDISGALPVLGEVDWNGTVDSPAKNAFRDLAAFNVTVGNGIKGNITMFVDGGMYWGNYSAQSNRRIADGNVEYSGKLEIAAAIGMYMASRVVGLKEARYEIDVEIPKYKAVKL